MCKTQNQHTPDSSLNSPFFSTYASCFRIDALVGSHLAKALDLVNVECSVMAYIRPPIGHRAEGRKQ